MRLIGGGLGLAVLAAALGACGEPATSHGDAEAIRLVEAHGCGGCHVIPGITGANGHVGPPLTGMGRRVFIAGMLRNTPDNMVRWLRDPQSVVPGNAMPNMGRDARDARVLSTYLATLR